MVVPLRDGADTILDCLEALAAQDLPIPWLAVVDDGSRDAGPERVLAWARAHPELPLRLLRRPPRGAAAARNAGLHALLDAGATYVLYTDADCQPAPDWARRLLAALDAPGVTAAMGGFETGQMARVARLVQAEYADKEAGLAGRRRLRFADTATAGFRAEALRAAGGFREDLGAVEDTELAFRLASRGARLVYAPAARVRHRHPDTWAAYARRKLRFGRWGARAYGAHPARVADDGRTPGAMRLQMGLVALAALSGGAALLPGRRAPRAALAGAALAAAAASGLPFARRAAARGAAPDVVAAIPAAVLLRAAALDAGLLWGAAEIAAARLRGGTGGEARRNVGADSGTSGDERASGDGAEADRNEALDDVVTTAAGAP